MFPRAIRLRSWRYVVCLLAVLGLALLAGQAYASKLAGSSSSRSSISTGSAPAGFPGARETGDALDVPFGDSFLELEPGTGGTIPAPSNGDTVPLGSRFVLNLMMYSGSSTTVAQQSYLTFTSSILQNARVSSINSSCTLTSTVTGDFSTYDVSLQNETCNGPANCNFRGINNSPGWMAFASIASNRCSSGCGGVFRVAQVGLCAVATGQAVLHWQFSPPAPITRDTEIIDRQGNLVHDPSLFTDFVIDVVVSGDTPTTEVIPTETPTPTPTNGVTTTSAFLFLEPGTGGTVPAPANGDTVPVGSRFVLDLLVNSGSHTDITAQQSYLTFTSSILQNARVSDINSSCTLTSTVTGDFSTYDASLQNETCNGPANCNFRGINNSPGWMAFASGASNGCSSGCGGVFRVAQVGLCAVATGQAVLHWQFHPPAPISRDTEIVDHSNNLVHDPSLFTDYVINVVAPPTSTPTATAIPLLQGHMAWEGRPAQPNPLQQLPISLTLRLTTGGPYHDYSGLTTDSNGRFTVSMGGLPNGTYNWRVKNPQYLANSGTVTLTGAPLTQVEMGLMLPGDVNGDNVVNSGDFIDLKGSFGQGCGNPMYDTMADFTGDCVVNALDFTLLRTNFGHGGSPPVRP